MTHPLFTLCLGALITTATSEDLLRFKNGDVIHGSYAGIGEGPVVLWENPEAQHDISFETKNLRKILFNKGRSRSRLKTQDLVELSNGDRLPGTVVNLDEKSLTFDGDFGGLLAIPRNHIKRLSINRHGPDPSYLGPFDEAGWSFQNNEKGGRKRARAKDDKEAEKKKSPWQLSGGAWYNERSSVLALETPSADRTSYKFRVAWRNHLNLSVAFLADFERPVTQKEDEELVEPNEENPSNLLLDGPAGHSDPERFGTSYLLSLHSNYIRLQRTGFDQDGRPETNSFKSESAHSELRDAYEATFEARVDRKKGLFTFYINGRRLTEWEDPSGEIADGGHLAFFPGNNSSIRLSDIAINNWNGMPDSALSMQSEQNDIVLLHNGTDRLSGKVLNISDDQLTLESHYATFDIPTEDVAEIFFASDTIQPAQEESQSAAVLHFRPLGSLTLLPKTGTPNRIAGHHQSIGELDLSLDSVYLIEFDPEVTVFDNWDDDF